MKKIVAITGPIGSGKSTILKKLEQIVPTLSVDSLQNDLYKRGNKIFYLIKNKYPQFIYDNIVDKEQIQTKLINDSHFKDEYQKDIIAIIIQELENIFKEHKGLLLVEIPYINTKELLILFDKIILLDALKEVRIKRIMLRDNISEKMAVKWVEAKVKNIDNNKTIKLINNGKDNNIKEQLEEVYKCLMF